MAVPFAIPGSQRTICRTCRSGRTSPCCCSRPSAWASASPGWFSVTKTSERKFSTVFPTFWLPGCVAVALTVLTQPCSVSSRWAWVLQDTLGIAFCLYMLKTVRLPTFKVLQLGSCVGSVGLVCFYIFIYILAVNSPVCARRRAPCY